MNGQIELILRSTYPGLLAAIEAEAARLNLERELLVEQRDRLLDGMWGKGAPPPEELPQVGESEPFVAIIQPDDGKVLFDALMAPCDPAPDVILGGEKAPLFRGELGTIDGGFRIIGVDYGREVRTSDIAPDPREQGRETMRAIGEGMSKVFFDTLRTVATEVRPDGITTPSLTALGDVDGPGTLHAGTVEHTPDTAAAVDAVKQAAEADDETVRRLNAQLDSGWRRVLDWRNQPNPFGKPEEEPEA